MTKKASFTVPSMNDPTDDINAQERVNEERQEQERLAALRHADDVKWMMDSERGRRIAWQLLDRSGVYRTSFTGDNETFFREGQRNIGLALLADINDFCPEKCALMTEENYDRPASQSR